MAIIKNDAQQSSKSNESWFTGSIRIDPLFSKQAAAKAAGALATFELGARTAWHSHPAGQTLNIVSGLGWIQKKGKMQASPSDRDSGFINNSATIFLYGTACTCQISCKPDKVLKQPLSRYNKRSRD